MLQRIAFCELSSSEKIHSYVENPVDWLTNQKSLDFSELEKDAQPKLFGTTLLPLVAAHSSPSDIKSLSLLCKTV